MNATVSGIEDVVALMQRLRTISLQKALGYALAAAGVPIVGEIHVRCPERLEVERDETIPHLADSLESLIEIDRQGRGGRLTIGFGKQGYIALWVEYGHRIVTHKPALRDTGKRSKPNPFLRESMDAAEAQAVDRFFETFIRVLEDEITKSR